MFGDFYGRVRGAFFTFTRVNNRSMFVVMPYKGFIFKDSVFCVFLVRLIRVFTMIIGMNVFGEVCDGFQVRPSVFFSRGINLCNAISTLYCTVHDVEFYWVAVVGDGLANKESYIVLWVNLFFRLCDLCDFAVGLFLSIASQWWGTKCGTDYRGERCRVSFFRGFLFVYVSCLSWLSPRV